MLNRMRPIMLPLSLALIAWTVSGCTHTPQYDGFRPVVYARPKLPIHHVEGPRTMIAVEAPQALPMPRAAQYRSLTP